MLNLLPVFFLLLIIIGLVVIRRSRLSLGTVWLILTALVLLNFGIFLFLKVHLPTALVINDWFPLTISQDSIVFSIGQDTWILFFALASLLAGTFFASSAHLQNKNIYSTWITLLGLTVVGMLALLADSPIAFLFGWALIDLVEIITFISIHRGQGTSFQTYAIFVSRLLGLGMVMLAVVLAGNSESPLTLGNASGNVLVLLIVGASLRLGVLPIHLPYTSDLLQQRSTSTILHILVPLSAISFLAKLAVPQSVTGIVLIILLMAIASCLFGAVNWFRAKNELEGQPYWLLAFSGFALISYLHGQSLSVLIWGALMVVVGGWSFLSESHSSKMDLLLPVALITLSGIPFTPAAIGIVGISTGPYQAFNPLLWISLSILMAGMVKFSLSGGDIDHPYENWMKFFYLIGMGLLILSPWCILLFKTTGWNQTHYWWVSVIELVIFAVVFGANRVKFIREKLSSNQIKQGVKLLAPYANGVNRFFYFDWLYRFLGFLFEIQRVIINGFNLIFEGEGGILWAVVFLVLLASLLVNGGGSK
jgi:hypothetical protein